MYTRTELFIRLGYLINFFVTDKDEYGDNEIRKDKKGYCEVTFNGFSKDTVLTFASDPEDRILLLAAQIDGQKIDDYDITLINYDTCWQSSFTEICDKIGQMKSGYDEPFYDFDANKYEE